MTQASDARWALAVRALAIVALALALLAVFEGWAIRRYRAELTVLRAERDRTKEGLAAAWAQQAGGEFGEAVRWLDGFYADPISGFGKTGGLCADGKLNDDAIVRLVAGRFLPARAAGETVRSSLDAMKTDILKSDAYRQVHPDLALPPDPVPGR